MASATGCFIDAFKRTAVCQNRRTSISLVRDHLHDNWIIYAFENYAGYLIVENLLCLKIMIGIGQNAGGP
jgi:hypothetical protein